METIHIFDDDREPLTDELRHEKRLRLEPLIFNILKQKYGTILLDAWKNWSSPTGNKACVIVERRIHPNLEFLIHNVAYMAPDWKIIVICSDINYKWLETITDKKVTLLPFFLGSPSRQEAINAFNAIMTDPNFYRALPAEHLFFFQTDSYIRKPIPDSILEYDLVAAPYEWERSTVGGGTSYRKRSSMIRICEEPHENVTEDIFICQGARRLNLKIPHFTQGMEYIVESTIYEDPVAVHQWWTFFSPEGDESIFKSLLDFTLRP